MAGSQEYFMADGSRTIGSVRGSLTVFTSRRRFTRQCIVSCGGSSVSWAFPALSSFFFASSPLSVQSSNSVCPVKEKRNLFRFFAAKKTIAHITQLRVVQADGERLVTLQDVSHFKWDGKVRGKVGFV